MINLTKNFKGKLNSYLNKFYKIKDYFQSQNANNKKYYKLVLTKDEIKLIDEAINFYVVDLLQKDDIEANNLAIIRLKIKKVLGELK